MQPPSGRFASHLAWCLATKIIFETIEALASFTPPPGRSRTQKTKDRLFAYPDTNAPESLRALYVIAWKYLLRDFYKVEFESYDYHYIPILESTLVRFTTLVRGLAPPGTHSSMRTYTAAQGRKPKLKKPLELSTPVLVENERGKLQMSDNFSLVAKALGLAERLA